MRVISEDFQVIQRLVRLQLLEKSLTGEEIARELVTVLSVGYAINPTLVLCAMRDGASTNNVAMRTLNVLYSNIFDVTCFSHMLDCVGNHFNVPILLEFINGWVSLFSHSSKVKLLWKEKTGKAMASYSTSRWWSKWELMAQVFKYFRETLPYSEYFSSYTSKASAIFFLRPPTDSKVMEQLAFECFEVIDTIRAFIQSGTTPNVQAVADRLSGGVPSQKQLVLDHVHKCVKPAIDYFNLQLSSILLTVLSLDLRLHTSFILRKHMKCNLQLHALILSPRGDRDTKI